MLSSNFNLTSNLVDSHNLTFTIVISISVWITLSLQGFHRLSLYTWPRGPLYVLHSALGIIFGVIWTACLFTLCFNHGQGFIDIKCHYGI